MKKNLKKISWYLHLSAWRSVLNGKKKVKIAPHCICILCVRQYKMNSQLNKVAAICALVIVATYVFQGQANPLGIPSYQFGVEVPLYRIKLPAFAIGNILFALSVRWVLEFFIFQVLRKKTYLNFYKVFSFHYILQTILFQESFKMLRFFWQKWYFVTKIVLTYCEKKLF